MAAEGIEYCLVVPRIELFGPREENVFSGFIAHDAWNVDLDAMVQKHGQYLPRRAHQGYLGAEEDPTQKQIIPVGIFRCGDQVFAYQRLQGSSEERLHGWQQVLIGGHVNPEDQQGPDLPSAPVDAMLERALRREFHEEMNYGAPYVVKRIGYLNIDEKENVLDLVHFGVVYLIEGSAPDISVRETASHEGHLRPSTELSQLHLKGWSQIAADALLAYPLLFPTVLPKSI